MNNKEPKCWRSYKKLFLVNLNIKSSCCQDKLYLMVTCSYFININVFKKNRKNYNRCQQYLIISVVNINPHYFKMILHGMLGITPL